MPHDIGPSARHFALSDALARIPGPPTVWSHSADKPTLVIGAGQDPRMIPRDRLRSSGVSVVKRHAGGTSVYATPEVLGIDVALPSRHRLAVADVVEAYRWCAEVWVEALRSLGVETRIVSIEEARSQRIADGPVEELVRLVCFGSLSPYEVVVGTRKLVGLAQVRRRDAVLIQAGIHVHFDAARLASLLPGRAESGVAALLRERALGLDETVANGADPSDVAVAFQRALSRRLRITLDPGPWTPQELQHADALAQ